MSNQNTEPNTVDPLESQDKLSGTTQSSVQKSAVKPSQLFTNTDNPANNIIVSNVPKAVSNIFGNSKAPSRNIFDSENGSKNINLFNVTTIPQTTGGSNIFKSASKPLIATQQDDDEKSQSNGSSQRIRKTQIEFKSVPETLQMKYKYNNPWIVVKSFNLRKFKNGANSSKEHIYLTLQRNSESQDKLYFMVRARETKVMLFQGFGLKNVTDKLTTFMNKEENVKVNVITQTKRKENNEQGEQEEFKPKLVKEELKIQFETMEDAKEFRELIMVEFGEKSKGGQINKNQVI